MMLEHMGWQEAADRVRKGLIGAIQAKQVTYDLARQMEGSTEVACSRFAEIAVDHMPA
jgi:isocitrate dehydrogenase